MKDRIIFLMVSLIILSCIEVNCEKLIQPVRDRECLIIVEEFLPYQEQSLNVKGINPTNGKECICKDGGRWWNQQRDKIRVGDTIIKRAGELTFNIHKKDTVLSYQWECEGKKYY